MAELLQAIDNHCEAILLGELGALLHMFGKCSSEFLAANSLEDNAQDSHQDLKHLPALRQHLENTILKDRFAFNLCGRQETLAGTFTDFITKYKGTSPDCALLKLFNTCHRMTSADEKGVVRRKQSIRDMWITTPFGYKAHKIDLVRVEAKREEMDRKLAEAFGLYLSGTDGLERLHEQAFSILKPGLSQALGETRRPANDVTLWAQSYGVASLYKPVLATLALGRDPCPRKNGNLDYNNIRWRLFGIGWNGQDFIQRGRKPGDILKRQEILDKIDAEICKLGEVTHPVGNRLYADLNGVFFTFPGIANGEAEDLVKQLAPEVVEIVRRQSKDELWPFFTLSKPRRTLTAITNEIEVRDRIATAPKVAAFLSTEQNDGARTEELVIIGPALAAPATGQDICPVCQVRSKPAERESCGICGDRRSGRQASWQKDRHGQTIWVDEVADKNNRIALLTLRFDLSRWLNGEWLTTILSQTFDDWLASNRTQSVLGNQQQRKKLDKVISPITPTNEAVAKILAHVIGQGGDEGFKAGVLNTFFEDVQASQNPNAPNYIKTFLESLRGRIDDDPIYQLTPEYLTTAVFTQNTSPARLGRIWEETEGFLLAWLARIGAETFMPRPQRLSFLTTSPIPGVCKGQTYRITVPKLTPGPLTVLCCDDDGKDFLTIDSLEKFRFGKGEGPLCGLPAVQQALKVNGIESWLDESTDKPLLDVVTSTTVIENSFQIEPYLPFIVMARSPVFYQVLLPADRVPDVLRRLLAIASERFSLVEGKIPLHIGLLAAKRRFPLYTLFEAGQQMLDNPVFQKGNAQIPWWETTVHASDSFYGYYPNIAPDQSGHKLRNLVLVNRPQKFWLTPGYFDFDFLGSTADRHRLTYKAGENDQPIRPAIAYGHLCPRPFPLHCLRTMFEIWDLLVTYLGPTQRHHLQEALTTKLEDWETTGHETRPVFNIFSKTVLCRSFSQQWKELSTEQKGLLEQSASDGLLLEALELFQHVLKEDYSNE